jgi:DNA-binding transcriptional LysR family regulator
MQLRPTLLPSLGVFAAAARHQNLAHAAEELHLTASAVSHHVRKLEGLLGVSLFQRHARGVTLTPEGRQLADAATAALADVAAVAGALHPQADVVPLKVTTLHSLAYCWLLPRLPRFCAAHPQVRVEFDSSPAFARFDDNGPELGIRYGAGHWPGLISHHLMDDELSPVASPALAGVHGAQLPTPHVFSDSTDVMRAAVYGLGAVLARKHIAAPYLQRYELVRLPGPAIRARFAYYVVHAAHRPLSPVGRLFLDWLKDQARDERTPMPAVPDELLGRTPTD